MIIAGNCRGSLAASVATMRVLANLLFGVRPTDPVTLVAVAALLGGVAFLASLIPAPGDQGDPHGGATLGVIADFRFSIVDYTSFVVRRSWFVVRGSRLTPHHDCAVQTMKYEP